MPAHPVFFTKAATTVTGPYDPIPFDARVSGKIDWEAELGVIIGAPGKNISELSLGMALEPGDVISTGTPQGVGFAHTPPEYLSPGDMLETEIGGIGTLRNPIGAATA